MDLTEKQIRDLVDNPEQASSGEEHRLLKLMSGEGKVCTPQETRALSVARAYKQTPKLRSPAEHAERIAALRAASDPSVRKRVKRRVSSDPGIQAALNVDQRRSKSRVERKRMPLRDTGPHQPRDYHQYVDEGISGSREDNERARTNNSRDSSRRNNS